MLTGVNRTARTLVIGNKKDPAHHLSAGQRRDQDASKGGAFANNWDHRSQSSPRTRQNAKAVEECVPFGRHGTNAAEMQVQEGAMD